MGIARRSTPQQAAMPVGAGGRGLAGRTLRAAAIPLVLLFASVADATPPVLRFVEAQQNGVGGVANMLVPNTPAVSPDGKNVYVTADGSYAVVVFTRSLTTGALTFMESHVQGVGGVDGIAGANGVVVSPDGGYVYVTGGTSKAVAIFGRNAASGALTYLGKQTSGFGAGRPWYIALSPDGASAYVSSSSPYSVVVYARDSLTGALTLVETQEEGVGGVPPLAYPVQLVVSPDGAHLYLASFGNFSDTGRIASFARNSATGALTFLASYSSPTVPGIGQPNGITIDPTGSHVYVASWADGVLTGLARDATTGALTFQQSAGGGGGHRLAMGPDGGRVYMASWVDALRVFTRDPATGSVALAQTLTDGIDGVDGLWGSIAVAASPDGRSVYGQGIDDNAVSVFRVACDDGVVETGEACDDGNVASGDGCDGTCQVEAGWECLGEPSWCTPVGAKIPVVGLKLIVTAKSTGARAVFTTKDPAVTKGPGINPADIHASLHVAYDGTKGAFQMPAGASWLVNKDTVAKYVNKAAPVGGSVRTSVIKPGVQVNVAARSLGDTPLDVTSPPSGAVYVAHGVVNGGEEHWHCTQFTGCVHKLIAGGTGHKLTCKGSSAGDAGCAARVR
ncbi:MAG: beta-propeller fold lactonase family protein [Candidatus Binatia bacterium]